jgi:hypothetical protein
MNKKGFASPRLALLAVLLLAEALAAPATTRPHSATTGKESAPLPATERLTYRVEWNPPRYLFLLPPMEVGEATLSLVGETRYNDKKALKIVFTARSSGTLVRLFGIKIDDYFEFTTDPETFCTYCVTKKIREGRRMRDIDLVYHPESRQLHMREVDVSTLVPRVLRDKDYEEIPPCVRDLFSALYSFRRTDLTAGTSRRVLVGDDEHIKEVEVRVKKSERVATPAGDFMAWRVDTVAIFGGLFKSGGQFRMWLSADDRKIPVKFEAKASIGKVVGSLREAR